MRRLIAPAATLVVALGLSSNALATERAGSIEGSPVVVGGATSSVVVGTSTIEYDRVHSNGMRELGFSPSPSMSAPPTDPPRSAYETARLFLEDNGSAIGIVQAASAFKLLRIESLCDGSEKVVLQQTYALLPIKTSSITMIVRNQVVTSIRAAFIADPAQLPVCQPTVGRNDEVAEIYYLPETTQTVVVIVLVDRVGVGTVHTLRDACTGIDLGTTTYYP